MFFFILIFNLNFLANRGKKFLPNVSLEKTFFSKDYACGYHKMMHP